MLTVDRQIRPIAYDDAPLRPFHRRVIVASVSGQLSDGFEIGIIGIALHSAASELGLSPLWLGLLGGAALMGLFFGALLTGPFADRFGRRVVFASNMLLIALFSALQFLATTPETLFVLRFVIGFLLGTDYVVAKTMLMEVSPARHRGRIVSVLAIAWAAGYVCAYFIGFALDQNGAGAWRWILLTGVVPALACAPLRLAIPESPAWLVSRNRAAEALAIVRRHLGDAIALPAPLPASEGGRLATLFSARWYRRTAVGATFFTCQVIPYFALGTFVARVMDALGVADGAVGGMVYNLFLMLGAIAGWQMVDMISRRAFLVGSFLVAAAPLLLLALWPAPPEAVILAAFAIVAFTLSAASSLCYVYLTELFPTGIRASGVGVSVAASRLGSAASTFLLPLIVASYGIQSALGLCVVTSLFGAALCFAWAPETRRVGLDGTAAP